MDARSGAGLYYSGTYASEYMRGAIEEVYDSLPRPGKLSLSEPVGV